MTLLHDLTSTTKNLKPKGKVREQTWCPLEGCGSRDAFTIYEYPNGTSIDGHCFSCGRYSKDPYGDMLRASNEGTPNSVSLPTTGSFHKDHLPPVQGYTLNLGRNTVPPEGNQTISSSAGIAGTYGLSETSSSSRVKVSLEEGATHPIRPIPHRGLSRATCERFNVRVGVSATDGETPIYTLFPQHHNGEQIGWLTKSNNKDFIATGGQDLDLFGSNIIPPKGKKLWITTGLEDAMSIYQVLKESSNLSDWEPSVVSISNGDRSALKSVTRQYDLLTSYEEVILVFDNDASGKQARDEVLRALAGKVSYVTLPLKDANAMLQAGRGTELKWACLAGYKKYQPDGIVNAKDLWERYTEKKETPSYPYPPSMPLLNSKTRGARPGSIITVTSGTGMGKSQFLKELMHHYLCTTNEKIAGMFLEEDVPETLQSLLALQLNKRLGKTDAAGDIEEEQRAFQELFESGRVSLYDFFGGMDDGSLLGKLQYYALTGHKFIFLDHLSIVVSEYASEGGERERIDTLMTKLAKFVKEFNIVLFLVVHLRKTDTSRNKSFEEGLRPSLDDLRGSGSLKQLSWDVIGLSRNQQHEDPYCANTTEVCILKCRHTGNTGVADYLHYDRNNGRMYSVAKPVNYIQKKNNSNGTNEEF